MSAEIEHVSDTAYWVAAYRARETERKDALFRDPLAAVLLGERGRAIERNMPGKRTMYFVMVTRTCAIDALVAHALERGVDTVLNLGAGLDTRPYRMDLPRTLRWLEADFPIVIAHKDEQLAREKPRCELERVAIDLADRAARKALFRRIAERAQKVLVLSEGVIPYLKDDEVSRLAEDIMAEPKLALWIQDYYSAQARKHRPSWRKKLRAAPFQFQAPDWFGFFAERGFVPLEKITIREQAERIHRRPPFPYSLPFPLIPAEALVGYTLLGKQP